MDANIKKVLEKIESNGFEAYIVGGYVRDLYLGRENYDVDICTNALPKDLIKIFKNGFLKKEEYGSFKLIENKWNFDITTYREEKEYNNRRPIKIEYVNNLLTDINRRDFTINSLCMNKDGDVIDILNGKKDIEKKEIKVIGDIKKKLKEDPLRCLRAIRFATILDFKMDKEIIKFIKNNKILIKGLSYSRKKDELTKILASQNASKGLKIIKDLGLEPFLEIKYKKIKNVTDISAMWAQLKVSDNYNFTTQEKNQIKIIKNILKYGKINNSILYKYGLYYSVVAGEIFGINKDYINQMYRNMVIKNIKDIKITSKEIINLLNIEPSALISKIYADLEIQILNNKLINENEVIKNYILRKWRNERKSS